MKNPLIKKEIFEKNKKDENKKIFSKINSDPKKPLQNNKINFLSKSNSQEFNKFFIKKIKWTKIEFHNNNQKRFVFVAGLGYNETSNNLQCILRR